MHIYNQGNIKYYVEPDTNKVVYITDDDGKQRYVTKDFVDISYQSKESLARILSNLYPYHFDFKEHRVHSIEGVIQSLKHPEPEIQKLMMMYSGMDAYHTGGACEWDSNKPLYWMGKEMNRFGIEYQAFLSDLYLSAATNPLYIKALSMVGDRYLFHSIGSSDPFKTTLTVEEYLYRLNCLRQPPICFIPKKELMRTLDENLFERNQQYVKKRI